MKKQNALLWHLACMLWLMISAHTFAQPVRIAVAGDPSLANLIDVTTGELSKETNLTVLDRASLDKLGQEQQIQSVLDSKDFSPVHLLPADGLVLLRSVSKDGKPHVFARLVAVQPGVVLREMPLPEGIDPLSQAQALVKEFAPYWPKLAALQNGKITALSLLGLHFDVDSPATREMERSMNLLLASRLSAEPDVVVLERWRLNDTVFEKSLATPQPAAFWTGSGLIDGGMRLKDGVVEVSLRLRPTHGPEISISDQDQPQNLAALAGRLADKIRNQPASTTAWNPATEAAHYVELGKWSLDNRLFADATEALESALALGDNARTTHMLLVESYAMQASLSGMEAESPEMDNYLSDGFSPDTLPLRVSAATNAARLTIEYLKSNSDFSSPKWTLEDPIDLSVPILHICLQTLRLAYVNGFAANHSDELTDLRHKVQELIGIMGDKLLTQPPSPQRGSFLSDRAYFAGLWHDKPQDTIAFYREILKSNPVDGEWVREILFRSEMAHEPYLDGEGEPFTQSRRDFGPPWIMSWEGAPPADLKTLWQNFLQELAASSDPVLQVDAFKFEMASDQTKPARIDVTTRFVTFLKSHPDSISGPRGTEFVTGNYSMLYGLNSETNPAAYADLIDVYVNLFGQQVPLPTGWINDIQGLVSEKSPDDAVKRLLAGLDAYAGKFESQQGYQMQMAIKNARHMIYRAKPGLVPVDSPGTDAEPLTVNRYWDAKPPSLSDPTKLRDRPVFVDTRTFVTEGNTLWFLTEETPHILYGVDTSTMLTTFSCDFPKEYDQLHMTFPSPICFLEVTPQWLVATLRGQVLFCSRSDKQWHPIDLPLSNYKPRWVNQQLYLLYDAVGQRLSMRDPADLLSASSGLIRVSLPEGTTESLVSSRRIPPQTALDGKPLGTAVNMWQGPASLMMAFTTPGKFQAYSSPLDKNDWEPAFTEDAFSWLSLSSGGALICKGLTQHGYQQIIWSDAKGRQVLLSEDSAPQGANVPEWTTPPEMHRGVTPIRRGDDLCVFTNLQNGKTDQAKPCLFYFAKGQKSGVKIPLAFDLQQLNNPILTKTPTSRPGLGSVHSTDYGMVIGEITAGFWVIPWSDIDAYLAKANSAPPK